MEDYVQIQGRKDEYEQRVEDCGSKKAAQAAQMKATIRKKKELEERNAADDDEHD
eukprot:gene23858-23585_t